MCCGTLSILQMYKTTKSLSAETYSSFTLFHFVLILVQGWEGSFKLVFFLYVCSIDSSIITTSHPQDNWQNYKGKSEHKTDVAYFFRVTELAVILTQWEKILRKRLQILGIYSLLLAERSIH